MSSEKEIKALIHLLDDPDHEVNQHVVSKLLSYGRAIIPTLESVWEDSFDPSLQKEIEQIIGKINLNALEKELKLWKESEPDNLLKGVILIAQYQYPDLDIPKINAKIEELRRAIWLEISHNFTPLEQVNIFNHVLFSLFAFKSNAANLQDPQYFYINILLESKKGNPTSLGILYLILAQQLEMPIYGVNLPQHFILAHTKYHLEDLPENKDERSNIIFYINPFNKGIIFTKNEIDLFLKKLNIEPHAKYYLPCSNLEIIAILLKGLIYTYQSIGSLDKVEDLTQLLSVVEE